MNSVFIPIAYANAIIASGSNWACTRKPRSTWNDGCERGGFSSTEIGILVQVGVAAIKGEETDVHTYTYGDAQADLKASDIEVKGWLKQGKRRTLGWVIAIDENEKEVPLKASNYVFAQAIPVKPLGYIVEIVAQKTREEVKNSPIKPSVRGGDWSNYEVNL